MVHAVIIPHGFQEHYSLGFANGLARRGVTVDFVSSANTNTAELDSGIRWNDLGCNTEGKIGLIRKAYRFVAYHLRLISYVAGRRGAVVHVIGLIRRAVVLTGIVEGLLFRVLARKYVLTVHNLLPHDKHTAWNRWLFTRIYRIPHLLVVHTAKMKHGLTESFGVSADRIVVMQHGLNDIVPDHGRTRAQCRERLGVPPHACVLLFFGRIRAYKGLETLLEAFGLIAGRDLYLVIAGARGDASYARYIEKLLQVHPCREFILYHDRFIETSDVASYFRAANALVIPYRHIDQSGVLFLALRFKLPVIAFDIGSLKEYIQHDAGVVLKGSSAEELASGIREFRCHEERFTPERIEKYAERYRWVTVLEPLIRAYQAE